MAPIGDGGVVVIETIIETTVKALGEKINEAEGFAREDVKRCKIYLEAAQAAIQGLENEYDAILNQAEICRLDQRDQIQSLRGRIRDYLYLDRFRAVLWDVHAGLRGCRAALQENNERLLIFPWIRERRQEVIADFVRTLETLERYIDDLQNNYLRHREKIPTGVGVYWLNRVDEQLSDAENLYYKPIPPTTDQLANIRNDLGNRINEARQDRNRDGLKISTTRIRETIEKLIRAFR